MWGHALFKMPDPLLCVVLIFNWWPMGISENTHICTTSESWARKPTALWVETLLRDECSHGQEPLSRPTHLVAITQGFAAMESASWWRQRGCVNMFPAAFVVNKPSGPLLTARMWRQGNRAGDQTRVWIPPQARLTDFRPILHFWGEIFLQMQPQSLWDFVDLCFLLLPRLFKGCPIFMRFDESGWKKTRAKSWKTS